VGSLSAVGRWTDTAHLRQVLTTLAQIAKSPTQRKHWLRWLRSLREGYLFDEPSPWITFDAIEYVQAYIDRERRGASPLRAFEYGSGGSTRFWQSRGFEVVSIEHDPKWYEVVRSKIDTASVDYRLLPPEQSPSAGPGDPSDPNAYASGGVEYEGLHFRRYASAIADFPDGHFTIVLVDGRARPSCLMHAAKKVRPGGLLVLDNAERTYYTRHTAHLLSTYKHLEFPGALPTSLQFTKTDVYVNPA
jgi:hypothetical protein